jgi:hypothetical protein
MMTLAACATLLVACGSRFLPSGTGLHSRLAARTAA